MVSTPIKIGGLIALFNIQFYAVAIWSNHNMCLTEEPEAMELAD